MVSCLPRLNNSAWDLLPKSSKKRKYSSWLNVNYNRVEPPNLGFSGVAAAALNPVVKFRPSDFSFSVPNE